MALKRFGVSLEETLLYAIDGFVKDNGFSSRSQAIGFFIEKNIAETKWQCDNVVAGTIVIMYDHSTQDIVEKISSIQQSYKDVILSSSQYYLNDTFCLHIATVKGVAHRLTALSDRMITIKGIKHGKLVMSRAD